MFGHHILNIYLKTSIHKGLYFVLNVLCDKPSFTSAQKYGFHTGIKCPNLGPCINCTWKFLGSNPNHCRQGHVTVYLSAYGSYCESHSFIRSCEQKPTVTNNFTYRVGKHERCTAQTQNNHREVTQTTHHSSCWQSNVPEECKVATDMHRTTEEIQIPYGKSHSERV